MKPRQCMSPHAEMSYREPADVPRFPVIPLQLRFRYVIYYFL